MLDQSSGERLGTQRQFVLQPETDVAAIDLSRLVTKVVMQPTRESNGASSSSSLLGLAPGGVYTAIAVARDAGGLLHHLFTLTRPFGKGRAVCFLWHYPSGRLAASPPVYIPVAGVTRHRALWCSDFPPPVCAGSDDPPIQSH